MPLLIWFKRWKPTELHFRFGEKHQTCPWFFWCIWCIWFSLNNNTGLNSVENYLAILCKTPFTRSLCVCCELQYFIQGMWTVYTTQNDNCVVLFKEVRKDWLMLDNFKAYWKCNMMTIFTVNGASFRSNSATPSYY